MDAQAEALISDLGNNAYDEANLTFARTDVTPVHTPIIFHAYSRSQI
jgi:hypothetical protein